MIVHVRASNRIEVSDLESDDVQVVTHRVLLPYLAGILRLNGVGAVHDDVVRLNPNWSGWSGATKQRNGTCVPEWAQITTEANALLTRPKRSDDHL